MGVPIGGRTTGQLLCGGGAVMDEVILQLVGNVRLAVLQELQQCTDG
jgi:hypothetical protein